MTSIQSDSQPWWGPAAGGTGRGARANTSSRCPWSLAPAWSCHWDGQLGGRVIDVRSGLTAYRIEGVRLVDPYTGLTVYRIWGEWVIDACGLTVYRIRGERVVDPRTGMTVFRVQV